MQTWKKYHYDYSACGAPLSAKLAKDMLSPDCTQRGADQEDNDVQQSDDYRNTNNNSEPPPLEQFITAHDDHDP